jgi:hypothetical protein
MLQLLLMVVAAWYPAGHSKQKVEALTAVYLPTGQLWHGKKLRLDLNLPVGHGFCSFVVIFARYSPMRGAIGLAVPAVQAAMRLGGHSAVHSESLSPGNWPYRPSRQVMHLVLPVADP